jgi:hypothetical protein
MKKPNTNVTQDNFDQFHDKIYVSVDCVVFGYNPVDGELNVLVFKRPFYPYEGSCALIGGFVGAEEDIDDASSRILKKFTGIDRAFLEQFKVYGKPGRALKRVVSIAYWSFIKVLESDSSLLKEYNASWVPIQKVPDLIFDHNKIITDALDLLRKNIKLRPIGFELLPQKFTLPELFNLYCKIYGYELDVRNFSRKMKSLGLLDKLEEKRASTIGRKANLYSFNKEKYADLSKQGFYLELE